MYNRRQFILWKRVPRPDGRVDKVPVDPVKLRKHDAHNPAIWMSHEDALERATQLGHPYGVGFVFTADDPYWFIDVDNAAVDGVWKPIVAELHALVGGVGIERSQSGTGLHYIGCGDVPTDRVIKCKEHDFDLYTEKRFVALAQPVLDGNPDLDATAGITAIVDRYLRPQQTETRAAEWTTGPDPEWNGPTDDDELIRRACGVVKPQHVFGDAVSFRQLWEGDEDAFATAWPDDHGERAYDYSRADAALAQHLAFWTGRDCERIERLMWKSALVRDKWDDDPKYLPRTIMFAMSKQTTVYGANRETTEEQTETENSENLTVGDQIEYFKGCTYVISKHRVLVPDGYLLKPDQFRACYGGKLFSMDAHFTKSTKNAWEAFTENRGHKFPRCYGVFFDPQREFGVVDDNRVNSFVPRWGRRVPGDVSLFTEHIERLLPHARDREILLSYLAAFVQHPGVKAQWAPCIQGAQGNGKSAIYNILEYVVGREYSHLLDPGDIERGLQFNAWLEGKLLICVEEIHTAGKWSVADRMKPYITNERTPLQGKGADQCTGDNVANFLFFSNHRDAVLKTSEDRRYAVFYTAQQSAMDIERDGMDTAYFKRLYGWLKTGGGNAAIAAWLAEYPISVELQGRSPETTSTRDAMVESLGVPEQYLLEAVSDREIGFRGGMISSSAAKQLLAINGIKVAPAVLIKIITNMGYVKHPALISSAGKIQVDGQRFRIYVKPGTLAYNNIITVDQLADIWRSLQTSTDVDLTTIL